MMIKVLTAAGLLFGTGVLTGLGVGRIAHPPAQPALDAIATPGPVGVEKPLRSHRTNVLHRPAVRPPGTGRLEQFKRAVGDLELNATQRERIELHFRESQERLRALVIPLQPEAVRELRSLRQRVLTELSKEQRTQFERQNADRAERPRPRAAERKD